MPLPGWAPPARRLHPRYRGHDGAAQSDRLPDRCEAAAPRARAAGTAGTQTRRQIARSYTRLGKIALIRHQRYAHAKQFKRANRMLRTLRTQLGRVIRDIVRKIAGNAELRAIFARLLSLASQVRSQKQRQRGPRIYSLHAPEVACIGKGKAHRPYEFGVKVSVATTLNRSKGGQFVAHVAALPGNPYDGHTLASVIPAITQQIGVSLTQVIADAGYRGDNAPSAPGLRAFTAGQVSSRRPSSGRCDGQLRSSR